MRTTGKEKHQVRKATNTKHNFFYSLVITLIFVFIVLQLQARKSFLSSFTFPSEFLQITSTDNPDGKIANLTARLRLTTQFLPLFDRRYADERIGSTWFMSSLNSTHRDDNITDYLHFPSERTQGRLLCVTGNSSTNGTKNFYALAWPDSLPENAALLPGLTFVSNTQFLVNNLWHGHGAMLPFVGWHKWRGCAVPARWVLYHWGMVRSNEMSKWVKNVAAATLRTEVNLESLDGGGKVTCFEEAVAFRRDEPSVVRERWGELYDLIRCRAREHCNVSVGFDANRVGLTLLLRTPGGSRSFKNDSAVISIFRRACEKVEGCKFEVGWPHNMTFCEQVRVMSNTDVLVSAHGAQMTNLVFMDRNSSIMELYPKGWREVGGNIKYVFHWLADRTGMRHVGSWWDTESGTVNCTRPFTQPHCKHEFYRQGRLGHNEAFFSNWTTQVLHQIRDYKLNLKSNMAAVDENPHVESGCPCG